MACTDWEVPELPLVDWYDARDVCASTNHDEAMARLNFLVEHGRRLGIVFGGPGTGKTLLLDVFSNDLRRQGMPLVKTNLLGLTVDEFLWSFAAQLGINPRPEEPRCRLWRSIADRLTEHRYQQVATVVVLDEAERAESGVLTQVERLLKLDSSPDTRLTVVLACDERHSQQLGPALLELCQLRIDLAEWQQDETIEHLQRWLDRLGQPKIAFDEQAKTRIHQLAGGNPRRINQLAELSLLAGKGEKQATINQETIDSVYAELSVHVGGEAAAHH